MERKREEMDAGNRIAFYGRWLGTGEKAEKKTTGLS